MLGNEACDIDSMVCSLVYAYFLSKVRLFLANRCSCLVLGDPERTFVSTRLSRVRRLLSLS